MTEVSSGHSGGPLPDAPAAPPLEPATIPQHLWLIALVVGAVAWVAGAVATAITDDTILVPNIIILGTFLVPVCTVLFVLSRPREATSARRRSCSASSPAGRRGSCSRP
jgi:hypothetical protein